MITWACIKKSDLKIGTEALICSAQGQALRTKYVKCNIYHTGYSPLCRVFGAAGETVTNIVCACTILLQKEYRRRHDNVGCIEYWELCGKCGLERSEKSYKHKLKAVLENAKVKLLWDFSIHCDEDIIARRPDLILVEKERKHCLLMTYQ